MVDTAKARVSPRMDGRAMTDEQLQGSDPAKQPDRRRIADIIADLRQRIENLCGEQSEEVQLLHALIKAFVRKQKAHAALKVQFESLQASEATAELDSPNPEDGQSVEAEPVEAEPVEAEPVEAEPVEAEPVEAEPVEAEPVEAEPVEAEAPTAGSDSSLSKLQDIIAAGSVPHRETVGLVGADAPQNFDEMLDFAQKAGEEAMRKNKADARKKEEEENGDRWGDGGSLT
jgi:hypothetical protein